jgi:putative glutamine amidotransferase
MDKIVILWGQDVDPLLYGESVFFDNVKRYWMRDDVEMKLLHSAQKYNKPVLGICRWMQIMNVAHGWTLYQNIKEQLKTLCLHMQNDHFSLSHRIKWIAWFLQSVWFEDNQCINTFHNQAVKDIAPWFSVCAHSEDGVIEAIENTEIRQYGVQRHPEISRRFDQKSKDLITWFVQKW